MMNEKAFCEQIDQRMDQIEKYKTDISELKVKNKRFCPSCGSPLAKDDAFFHSVRSMSDC